ncbi:MAG: hypothetical protein ACK4N5_04460 [Myxococcales bacterium]
MKARFYLSALCAALLVACSPEPEPNPAPPDAGPPVCDPAKCAKNNICVQNKCMLQCTRAMDCPTGYDCKLVEEQTVCVANNKKFGPGYFGGPCGVNGDRDCKAAEGFVCQGPLGDPEAYCTLGNCTGDADCPGTYYCGDVDIGYKQTRKTCLKREYCAPAQTLGDCSEPDAVIATDLAGNKFCTRICDPKAKNPCGEGNDCVNVNGGQCWPKPFEGKRSCIAPKKFCGRCESQADCPEGGLCYKNEFTREKMCLQPCGTGLPNCPTPTPGGRKTGCTTKALTGFEEWGTQCIPDPNDSLGLGCYFPAHN